MSLLPLVLLLSVMESQREGEKSTKKRSAENMEESSATAAAAGPQPPPPPAPPPPPLSYHAAAFPSPLLPLPVGSLPPLWPSDADTPSTHEDTRRQPPSASLDLPPFPAPSSPPSPGLCAPLHDSSTLSAISIVTSRSAATPQIVTLFTSPFPLMPPSAVVAGSSSPALPAAPATAAEPVCAPAPSASTAVSSMSTAAAAAPAPSAIATAVPTSSLPTAVRASTPRITLAKAATNLAVSLPTPQRSMSTKALLHLAHTVTPSSVVSQPSSSLSARFSIPVAALPSSSSASSSSSSAAAMSRSRPPPVSVRAHYLSEHVVSECKRRSPALHDMHIDDQFVARGVIEAIENELKNSISIITVRKRHMNAFRSLEGILYFMRYSNSQWMDCRDRALLMDLVYLFSACWLSTLQGLQAKRQLTPSNIHNLKEILTEILTFMRQMDSKWTQEMEEEAAAAGGSSAKSAAAGADKSEQRVVERVDVGKVLGPIVASVLTGEECMRLDVRRLEVMSPIERQETMEETAKLQLQSRIDRWMEQHRGMGGKAYDLTHWNHDQRLPYLLSTRPRSQQPASPPATAAAADRLLAASARPATFNSSTSGSLFTSTASALNSLSASAAVAAQKPPLLVKVESDSSAASSLSSRMVQSPASAIISSIATSSFSTMPSVGAASSPLPTTIVAAAPVFVSSQTGQSITTPSSSTFSSQLSSLPSSAFSLPSQQSQQQQHQQQQQHFPSLQQLQFMSEQLGSSASLQASQPASFSTLAAPLSPAPAPLPYQLQGTMTSSSFFYTQPSTTGGLAAAAAAQSMPAFTSSPSFFHSPQLIQTATGPALMSTLTQTTSAFPGSLMPQQQTLLPPGYLQLTQPLSYAALQQQQQLQWQQRQLEDQQMMIAMLSSLQQPPQTPPPPHLLASLNPGLYAQQQQTPYSALQPAPSSLSRFTPPVNPLYFNGPLPPAAFPFSGTAGPTSFQPSASLSPSSLYPSAYASLPQPLLPPAPPPSTMPTPPGSGPGGVG